MRSFILKKEAKGFIQSHLPEDGGAPTPKINISPETGIIGMDIHSKGQ